MLDGQNRLAAFRMLKEKYPENKTPIRVMVVNSDKSPLQLAIMFNAKHLNWSTNDYMEAYLEGKIQGYEQLRDFMKAYPEFELKAAIQLIKGKHSTKDFKEGTLKISNEEYMEATKKSWCSVSHFGEAQHQGCFPSGYRGCVLPCVGQDSEYPDVHQTIGFVQNAAH